MADKPCNRSAFPDAIRYIVCCCEPKCVRSIRYNVTHCAMTLLPLQPNRRSTTQGILFAIPAFLLMGISSSIGQLYFALFLYAIPSATVIPSLTTLASNHSSDNQKGTVLGILRSLGALARACGPILSSFRKLFLKLSIFFNNCLRSHTILFLRTSRHSFGRISVHSHSPSIH